MTFIWLMVWCCAGAPDVAPWSSWLVGLLVCLFLDVASGVRIDIRRS